MRPEPLTNLNDARRSLGQEVRMLEVKFPRFGGVFKAWVSSL